MFTVPTSITTVETESFSRHTYPELLAVFPENKMLERTSMNSWDERKVRDALAATDRNKGGPFWACGRRCATTRSRCPQCRKAATRSTWSLMRPGRRRGKRRNKRCSAWSRRRIVTWQQVLLEWQRDRARKETYDAMIGIVQEHSGADGWPLDYAYPSSTRRLSAWSTAIAGAPCSQVAGRGDTASHFLILHPV